MPHGIKLKKYETFNVDLWNTA